MSASKNEKSERPKFKAEEFLFGAAEESLLIFGLRCSDKQVTGHINGLFGQSRY